MPDKNNYCSGKKIRNLLEERDEIIFRTVCEELCKHSEKNIGEEAKWETFCKSCPLWKLL